MENGNETPEDLLSMNDDLWLGTDIPRTQKETSTKCRKSLKVSGELEFSDRLAGTLESIGFVVAREVQFPCRGNNIRADLMVVPPARLHLPQTILIEAKFAGETSAITNAMMQLIRYYRSFCGTPDGTRSHTDKRNPSAPAAWDRPELYLLATAESILDGHLRAWSSVFPGDASAWPMADGCSTMVLDRLLWKFGPISVLRRIGDMVGFESNWLGQSDGTFYPIAHVEEFRKIIRA